MLARDARARPSLHDGNCRVHVRHLLTHCFRVADRDVISQRSARVAEERDEPL
jgi:hypothetical protein